MYTNSDINCEANVSKLLTGFCDLNKFVRQGRIEGSLQTDVKCAAVHAGGVKALAELYGVAYAFCGVGLMHLSVICF